MARNLSKDLKRLVAGLCAVLIVGGAVPLQPLVNFSGTIKAVADGPSSVNVAKTYTKNSPELVDGVRLYKGDTILFEGIKNNRLSVYDLPGHLAVLCLKPVVAVHLQCGYKSFAYVFLIIYNKNSSLHC